MCLGSLDSACARVLRKLRHVTTVPLNYIAILQPDSFLIVCHTWGQSLVFAIVVKGLRVKFSVLFFLCCR